MDNEVVVRFLMQEYPRLREYCWLIVRDDHLVEDVLQEVGLVAVQQCDQIRDHQHLMAWLRRVCRSKSVDAVRRRSKRPVLLGEMALDLIDQEWAKYDGRAPAELCDMLKECVAEVTDYGRQILSLRYREGLKSSDIAKKLKRPQQPFMWL